MPLVPHACVGFVTAAFALTACGGHAPRPPAARGDVDHALHIGRGGYARLDLRLESFAHRDHTVALRFAPTEHRGCWRWAFAEGGAGTYVIGMADGRSDIHLNYAGGVIDVPHACDGPQPCWIHAAAVREGDEVRLYVDGRLAGRTATINPRWLPRGFVRFGRRHDTFRHEVFDGYVDDVWIFDGALDDVSIAGLAAGHPPPAEARVLVGQTFEPGAPAVARVGPVEVVPIDPRRSPPPPEPGQQIALSAVVDGPWQVMQGYETDPTHRGYAAYAIDLVPVEQTPEREMRAVDCGGRALRAPADGIVVARVDGQVSQPTGGASGVDDRAGNSLIIRHGDYEYSQFAHLEPGSIRYPVGAAVKRGAIVGRCGRAGSARTTGATDHVHYAMLSSHRPVITRPAWFLNLERWRPEQGWESVGGRVAELAAGDVIRFDVGQP